MKLSISFVPRKINPSASRWNFSTEAIEEAAHLMIKGSVDSEVRLSQVEARQVKLEARQIMLKTREIPSLRQQVAKLNHQLHHKTDLLQFFNQTEPNELQHQMKRIGLVGKTAERIVETIESERQQKRFVSLKEVVARVKGLTYEKIVDLIEV